jgi:lipopolysaccharide export system protein LptA
MEAGGDTMDYQGKAQGVVVVTGNAWATQDNNTLKSNRLTLYLAQDGQAKVK